MSTAVHIQLEESLNTDYEPDCDYVDGTLEERNVGGRRHSRTQARLAVWLRSKELEHEALIAQDVKVSPSRIRIPDICLVDKSDRDEIVERPPALWVEVLSHEDSWSKIPAKSMTLCTSECPQSGLSIRMRKKRGSRLPTRLWLRRQTANSGAQVSSWKWS
jgi:Uma2 family endonuclease